ncbi:DNA-formamidopyrimidine glycosylase [candidate division WOR-1 bacterium RIFOXYB2_FULL_42_35]|uniref:DNA-formamidopyrimidine glycosylase n=1 Tax=candidate division WOR-1 bacterium RIFOXYC2_FULL_41_25 TaxID=1802586 RepID=A0A1F4TJ05_UNCSA|nr:MAG: DNA-formamidopyrimidine glycosylase [candidate division WOR-1 bacterium RIFOXYA2_FULL_41_14]OGC21779.1 MAG: DNA-formamidopyrimidine glycosylase [candidate division WOR-1 bacterium RIFOXYB2_FULL_42_35]OGC32676.1 MAG: DNA-formamidopyrimidine glycosylase [candidate division WOR-1 bacterium RIFOXYC2_FULL_41_25]OGC41564.1 MAG: DNA-formamidopyrimidine glycosylase [candidate division WOR-1 bacterium RIFOXYD2_FULL_41_8]
MPELPEVETVKRGLAKSIVGKTIADFSCDWHKLINKPAAKYKQTIKDLKILSVERRAKMLIVKLSKGLNILVHLKMTGQLVYRGKSKCVVGGHPIKEGANCLPNKFTHVTFSFTDGSQLYYNDVRKFGWLRLYTDVELEKALAAKKMGPEPLSKEFSLKYLQQLTKTGKNRKRVKQFLMENQNLVGVGNIYSDEVCFYAGVMPDKPVEKLTTQQIKKIHEGIQKILKAAIKAQGTTVSDYRNADGSAGGYAKYLKVYQRYGEKCYRCKAKVVRMKIGGRTSHYCPQCQK